ncbi:sensor histidine kinase [Lederbergia citrea]|uniref:histidine kinase n=1 Tax=Lederbergia citrea TaxID=2833581 RepID=A0A942Z6X2_9BACI|nr:sensor histidine kinase [Lederbergia citrea]MBS4179177.1 sensor histidine kinase [Lederbergia citrea]MBS4205840.1 sensor histidine kinase [Lederbergia citrea]MBS4224712.1 sensor histidine kinase [Lederbergia citrea]
MKLTLLSSIRLIMFVLLSYIYYISVETHTTQQIVFVIVAALGFCINHLILASPLVNRYFLLALTLDSVFILGFVFFFPGPTLYLILFGVNAVTLFLIAENKRVIWGFSLAFFFIWTICMIYTYQVTGIIDVAGNIINFTFIVFEAIVGRLIHKLMHAQEKNENQYDELQETHLALKNAHQQLHHYSKQVEELTLIRERNRISGDIHDTVGHKMTALLVQLQVAKELQDIQPERSKKTILLCEELARNALQELRLSVRTLRENDQNHSFITIVRKILEDYQKMTGLKSDFYLKGDVSQIPISIQLDLTRIIQESITNAVRHGEATECNVFIDISDSIIDISIKDNGKGLSKVSPGFGLKNMRERVVEHGGQIVFESNPSEGFIVKASFPLKEIRWEMGGA